MAIGPLMEEFEVIPDWGYYAPFPYSPQRLKKSMEKLLALLEKISPEAKPRLMLAPTMAEYRKSLLYYTDLFQKLGSVAADLEKARNLAKASEKISANRKNLLALYELENILAESGDFPQKVAIRKLANRLRNYDVVAMRKGYVDTVYGIYNSGIPSPVDPRSGDAVNNLFNRFNCGLAMPGSTSSVMRPLLQATSKPYLLVVMGCQPNESNWTMSGWCMQGDTNGVTWRASGDIPALISRTDFVNKDYKWLVLRLTEGPAGGRKTVAINGKIIGRFVRTGPPVAEKKEWWVTRNYPIPEGLLKDGKIEIRFTDPGVAIAEVALSAERVADTE
jgi:hypothetical protein